MIFAALEDENLRLRDMRENSAGVAERVLVAAILNVDLDPFRHRVLLDKGAADGVFKGQAVLDARASSHPCGISVEKPAWMSSEVSRELLKR